MVYQSLQSLISKLSKWVHAFCLQKKIRVFGQTKNRYGTRRKQVYFRFSSRQTAQDRTQKAGSVGGMVVPTSKLHTRKHLQGVPLTLPQHALVVSYLPSPQPRLFPRLLQLSEPKKIRNIVLETKICGMVQFSAFKICGMVRNLL